ncbi:hypothetical protein DL771_009251 [Monosporascus sp. 5C6A]|nr:hypothetical protein DL771_009251 [Monosporascus sp. 5C6A]
MSFGAPGTTLVPATAATGAAALFLLVATTALVTHRYCAPATKILRTRKKTTGSRTSYGSLFASSHSCSGSSCWCHPTATPPPGPGPGSLTETQSQSQETPTRTRTRKPRPRPTRALTRQALALGRAPGPVRLELSALAVLEAFDFPLLGGEQRDEDGDENGEPGQVLNVPVATFYGDNEEAGEEAVMR